MFAREYLKKIPYIPNFKILFLKSTRSERTCNLWKTEKQIKSSKYLLWCSTEIMKHIHIPLAAFSTWTHSDTATHTASQPKNAKIRTKKSSTQSVNNIKYYAFSLSNILDEWVDGGIVVNWFDSISVGGWSTEVY